MDIEQLKTFCLVWEFHSFSKAALAQHISQSTVSTRIRSLEEELGQPLFERQNKVVTLTPAGESFYSHAVQLVDIAENAQKNIREFSSSTQLSIGATPTCAKYILTRVLPTLLAASDGCVTVNLRTVPQQQQLIEMFSSGMIHMAMISALDYPKSPHIQWLWNEPTVLVASSNHPLSQESLFRLEHLLEYESVLLIPDRGTDHYGHRLMHLCEETGFTWKPKVVVDNLEVAKSLVKERNMLSFLPLISVEEEIDTKQLISIPFHLPMDLSNRIYLFTRSGLHEKMSATLQEELQKFARERA